ncbi:MAG TPA: DUF1330 domain-containing protein, partial [Polyangia bacterium]|nr:DUF1330 domain-containing protein [Polyangia bacterium]
VAVITVRRELADQFRDYERSVATILGRHGGRIERTVVVPASDDRETFREIHLIRFPDRDGFAAFQADPSRAELDPLRRSLIVETTILVGEDGPDYGP